MTSLRWLLPALVPGLALCASPDHSPWQAILTEYVDEQHRVDYKRLKERGVPALDAYIGQLARKWADPVTPDERKAALINAYNALTVQWII
ncbi:MAG: hypothetical protein ACRD7E_21465, partial [Bryobacteraceae bacterium]